MVKYTPYHGLADFEPGDQNWDHSDLVEHVETTTPKSAPYAERPSSPPVGRRFWATDYRLLFRYDPDHQYADHDGWVMLGGTGVSANPRPGTTYLTNLDIAGSTTGISHTNLGDVATDDHHPRYADTEARNAVTGNVDAADLASPNATAADQAPLSDGTGGLSWVDIIQGLYDTGDTVILASYSSPGFTGTTTSTTYTEPSAWAERGILNWSPLHSLQAEGLVENFRIEWGAYRIHETVSGQTATFRMGTYGTSEAPYTDGRSEMSVTNTAGPNYRSTVQFSVTDITNYGVWTPVAEMKTDGGEARLDGAVFVQLKGDVA